MSDRTDLFKALNHFMVMLNVHVPSGEADVEMVVGDTAFRALSDAMDAAPHMAAKFYGDKFVLKVPSDRVVIRKRPAKTEAFPCGFRSPEGYACMKHEGHAFEHVVGDAASEETKVSGDLKTYSARQSRKAQLEREKADRPVHVTDLPKDDLVPAKSMMVSLAALGAHARACVEERGGALFIRHADLYAPPVPEETKPPARAHLKGCVLDKNHPSDCYVAVAQFVELFNPPPTLSPRQALGEALACVERAQSLIGGMLAAEAPNSVHAHAVRAGVLLIDVQPELRRAYEAAK